MLSSGGGGNTGPGMMMEIGDPSVQMQAVLCSPAPLRAPLMLPSSPCGTMFLFKTVGTPSRRDDLVIIDTVQTGTLADGCIVALWPIRVNDVWDAVFSLQLVQKAPGSVSVPVPLKQHTEHEAMLQGGPPQPVSASIHAVAHFIQEPPGTPAAPPGDDVRGRAVGERKAPLARGLMADLLGRAGRAVAEYPCGSAGNGETAFWACSMMLIGNRWRYGVGSLTADEPPRRR